MSYYLYVPISTDNQLLVFSMDADSGQLERKHQITLSKTRSPYNSKFSQVLNLQQSSNFLWRRQLTFEFFRQLLADVIGSHAHRFAGVVQGVFDNCSVLFFTEDDTDGWIFALFAHLSVERGQVKLHFPYELWLELADLQLNRH